MSHMELPRPPQMPGTGGAAGKPVPRRRALTKDAVIDAALAIVDQNGLDALTMRSLAQSLGTGAASLYAQVGSKDDLLQMLIERVIGEVQFGGAPDPERWREQLKALAYSLREMWSHHGDLARASFGRIPFGESALLVSEWMIGVMRAGGLSDRVIGLAADLVALYVGAISYEDSLHPKDVSPEELKAFIDNMRAYFESLPVDRFPNVVSIAADLTADGENEDGADLRFDFGLDVLIAGLEALSRRG